MAFTHGVDLLPTMFSNGPVCDVTDPQDSTLRTAWFWNLVGVAARDVYAVAIRGQNGPLGVVELINRRRAIPPHGDIAAQITRLAERIGEVARETAWPVLEQRWDLGLPTRFVSQCRRVLKPVDPIDRANAVDSATVPALL